MGLAFPAQPQSTPQISSDSYPYLLRISRVVPHADTCVLLRRDGGYHLERDHDDATEVYEGELTADELSRLHQWLDNEQLRKLTREQIMTPLVITAARVCRSIFFAAITGRTCCFRRAKARGRFTILCRRCWSGSAHCTTRRTGPSLKTPEEQLPDASQNRAQDAAWVKANSGASAREPSRRPTRMRRCLELFPPLVRRPAAAAEASHRSIRTCGAPDRSRSSFLVESQPQSAQRPQGWRGCGPWPLAPEKSSQEMAAVKAHVHKGSLNHPNSGTAALQDIPIWKALQHGNIPDAALFSLRTSPSFAFLSPVSSASVICQRFARSGGGYLKPLLFNYKNTRLVLPLERCVKLSFRQQTTSLRALFQTSVSLSRKAFPSWLTFTSLGSYEE